MKILIAVSQLPNDKSVVKLGGAIAQQTKSTLTLLHVVSQDKDQAAGQVILQQAEELLPDLTVDTKLIHGKFVKRILSEIHQGDYDLVIVDANLGAEPRHRHLSARARAIVRRSPISVLVFQPAVQKIKHVLICTGGLHLSDPVIETGAQLARAFNAEVSLLHVVGAIPSMYTGLDQIEETLPELLSTDTPIAQHLRSSAEILDQYQVPSQLILRHGIVNNEIIREVSLGEYDLIVTGPPKSSHGFIRLFLGDVVEDVIEHTAIPFLIVKQPLPTSV